jgi:hypothetical protein
MIGGGREEEKQETQISGWSGAPGSLCGGGIYPCLGPFSSPCPLNVTCTDLPSTCTHAIAARFHQLSLRRVCNLLLIVFRNPCRLDVAYLLRQPPPSTTPPPGSQAQGFQCVWHTSPMNLGSLSPRRQKGGEARTVEKKNSQANLLQPSSTSFPKYHRRLANLVEKERMMITTGSLL